MALTLARAVQAQVRVLAIAFFCTLAIDAQAQPLARPQAPEHVGNGVASTRDAAHYMALENELQAALSKHDRKSIVAMLAPDFSIRSSMRVDRADAQTWMQQEFSQTSKPRSVRDLSVRKVDGMTIVSFYLQDLPAAGAKGHADFVVDVWSGSEADSKLRVRISNPSLSQPTISSRPSGRQ